MLDLLLDEPCNPDQNHRSEDCYKDAPNEATPTQAEQADHPATNEATNDAQQNIGNHAISTALHDPASRPAGDQSNDDPPDYSMCHVILLGIRSKTARTEGLDRDIRCGRHRISVNG